MHMVNIYILVFFYIFSDCSENDLILIKKSQRAILEISLLSINLIFSSFLKMSYSRFLKKNEDISEEDSND